MKGVYSRSSTWNLPSPLPDLEDTERKFAMEVEKFLQSNQSRLLLHIDEHRLMSDISRVQARSNAACWLSPSEMSGDCHLP